MRAKGIKAAKGAKAAKAITKGGKAAAKIVRKADDLHHAWPKYLGGARNQKLLKLPSGLHKKYHAGLDKLLSHPPRGDKGLECLSINKPNKLSQGLRVSKATSPR